MPPIKDSMVVVTVMPPAKPATKEATITDNNTLNRSKHRIDIAMTDSTMGFNTISI
ncbi:hypothetical protein HMPREF3032_00605 [Veillonella sp. DNF00869]|nr:hypothetical protein HMPREF3032_00605 [Veillonella sp. DNF00869]